MNVLLLRHTRVLVPEGLCYGSSDVALATSFEEELAVIQASLGDTPRVLVSSPLTRCLLLATRLSEVVHLDPRLREYDFGAWEGRSWESLPRQEVDTWCEDLVHSRPPGGDLYVELQMRAVQALGDALVLADGEPLVLCTHAGVIRALLAYVRGLSLEAALTLPVPFGSLHRLEACTALQHGLPKLELLR